MGSKQAMKRDRREHTLIALLHDYRGDTVEAVARRLAPFAEPDDDVAGSVDCLLRALERMLGASRKEALHHTDRHGGTMDRVGELRRVRNEAAFEMRNLLVEIRDATAALFGRKASNRLLAIKGATARRKTRRQTKRRREAAERVTARRQKGETTSPSNAKTRSDRSPKKRPP